MGRRGPRGGPSLASHPLASPCCGGKVVVVTAAVKALVAGLSAAKAEAVEAMVVAAEVAAAILNRDNFIS